MSKMIEYINPQSHTIQLSSPDKKIVKIPGKAKVVLSDWYLNYCPKYLRVVRVLEENKKLSPKEINKNSVQYAPPGQRKPKMTPNQRRELQESAKKSTNNEVRKVRRRSAPKAQDPRRSRRDNVVGRRSKENTTKTYRESYGKNEWTISDNIGVGILSYNRLSSLRRLVQSIRKNTDLSRTTIFISDESTDKSVTNWLDKQEDIVVLNKQKRLGIAGNSNRLLRCLSRFKYGILLNDDVEILKPGWEQFYVKASTATNYHHFCYRQIGVYGAKRGKNLRRFKDYTIDTSQDKPHGAVMLFTNELFQKIGYFDEGFGYYGMEHVDWSRRASQSGLQPEGYHDVIGADKYFKIHQEKSAVAQRTTELQKAKSVYKKLEGANRGYIHPTKASEVPSISVVIPVREIGRQDAIRVVVNSMRSQLFPNIEIIVAEQDANNKLKVDQLEPCIYMLAKSKYGQQPFTKAMAFNLGIANASYEGIILQDGDMICPSGYVQKIYDILRTHEGIHIGSRVLYMDEQSTRKIANYNKIDKENKCERVVTYFEGGSLACTKRAYFECGGFNEVFEGYGVEDCDFFERLKYNCKFHDVRTEDFVHLWHGRTHGWQQYHRKNKKINMQLKKQYNISSYIASLVRKLSATYPEVYRELATQA